MQCLKTWIESEISRKTVRIKCPSLACKKVLKLEDIKPLASQDYFEKHKTDLEALKVVLDKNQAWCPAPDCSTVCQITNGSTRGNCAKCAKEFCTQCRKDWHFETTCEIEELGGNVRICPKCSVPIEKTFGCSIMRCFRCSTSFCWRCLSLQSWHGLFHQLPGRCKGISISRCIKVIIAFIVYCMTMDLLCSIPNDFEENSPPEEERLCFYILFYIFAIHLVKLVLIPSLKFIANPNEDNWGLAMGLLIIFTAFCLISLIILRLLLAPSAFLIVISFIE